MRIIPRSNPAEKARLISQPAMGGISGNKFFMQFIESGRIL
jgi:hypothetical protein